MHKVRLLVYHGVAPYIVFDGGPLPAKAGTETERLECVVPPPKRIKVAPVLTEATLPLRSLQEEGGCQSQGDRTQEGWVCQGGREGVHSVRGRHARDGLSVHQGA